GLAGQVNTLGWATHNVRLGHDKSSVSHWLRGRVPHPPTPELVAAALTARLGYEVTVEDIGLRRKRRGTDRADGFVVADSPQETAQAVATLTERDMRRRDLLVGAGFTAAAFAQPALYALTNQAAPLVAVEAGRQVGFSDVEAIRATTVHFRQLDQSHGGAHLRTQVVRVLNHEATNARTASYSEAVGVALFSALAELTCLAGYLTFDAGRHALAQRYYVQSLNLARHAGDRTFTAVALSCMSFQATYLGRAREGVALAAAARQHVGPTGNPHAVAMFDALQARGHALLGDQRATYAALSNAEKNLARADASEPTRWLTYFTEAELAAHSAYCLRDLGNVAHDVEPQVRTALAGYDPSCRRSRGFMHTVLATARLGSSQPDLEGACLEAEQALDIVKDLRSKRASEQLIEFIRNLEPFYSSEIARDLADRASALLAMAPPGPRA
ncbi:MAG: hypothetical protein ACRDTJ_28485, partial [Pseudonocardiaceae bacterium]